MIKVTTDLNQKTLRWQLAQWLELRWWDRYLRQIEPEAYRTQKRAYWQRLLERLDWVGVPGRACIEFGCGPAGVFLILDQQSCTAVDPLLAHYEQRLHHFRAADYPWVTFVAAPMETFQAEKAYPEAYCLNAINHVSNWERALDTITSCVTPGGRLLLGVDVHRFWWLRQLFRWLPGDLLHPQQHLRADYLVALEKRGWCIEKAINWRRGAIFDFWVLKARLAAPTN